MSSVGIIGGSTTCITCDCEWCSGLFVGQQLRFTFAGLEACCLPGYYSYRVVFPDPFIVTATVAAPWGNLYARVFLSLPVLWFEDNGCVNLKGQGYWDYCQLIFGCSPGLYASTYFYLTHEGVGFFRWREYKGTHPADFPLLLSNQRTDCAGLDDGAQKGAYGGTVLIEDITP